MKSKKPLSLNRPFFQWVPLCNLTSSGRCNMNTTMEHTSSLTISMLAAPFLFFNVSLVAFTSLRPRTYWAVVVWQQNQQTRGISVDHLRMWISWRKCTLLILFMWMVCVKNEWQSFAHEYFKLSFLLLLNTLCCELSEKRGADNSHQNTPTALHHKLYRTDQCLSLYCYYYHAISFISFSSIYFPLLWTLCLFADNISHRWMESFRFR